MNATKEMDEIIIKIKAKFRPIFWYPSCWVINGVVLRDIAVGGASESGLIRTVVHGVSTL